MIYNISGVLTHVGAAMAVVNCGGVGFQCNTTLTTLKQLGETGTKVNLFTYLNVREDAMDLFGFYDMNELECFKMLIGVSGIGPKAAIAILSELTPDKLALCIATGDSKTLTKAQGIGKKIAERAVLELKDKMKSMISSTEIDGTLFSGEIENDDALSQALDALVSLGFSRSDATVALSKLNGVTQVDDMIRQGLRMLSRQG